MTPENSLVTTKARDANPLVKLKIWGKRLKSVRSDQIHSSNKIILDTFTIRKKKSLWSQYHGPVVPLENTILLSWEHFATELKRRRKITKLNYFGKA